MKSRLAYVDIAKGILIILIAFGHTVLYSTHCALIEKYVYSFHVFGFFFVSGYTFSTNKSFKEFFWIKTKRLLFPYFFWAILFIVPYLLIGNTIDSPSANQSALKLLKDTIYAGGKGLAQNRPLWFLPSIFTTCVLYYYVIKICKNNKKHLVACFLISVIISLVTYEYLTIRFPYGLNYALILGFVFLGGNIFSLYYKEKFNKEDCYLNLGVIFLLFIMGTICSYLNGSVSYTLLRFGTLPIAMLCGLCMSIFIVLISVKIRKCKIIEYIGKNTMGILIFHKLPIVAIQSKFGFFSSLLKNSNFIVEFVMCIITTLIAVFFSLLVTAIIRKISPCLIGEKGIFALKIK